MITKHAGGRPTKYNPILIDKVDEYLEMCGREQTKLPKKKEFAVLNGFSDENIAEWTAKYPEFSRAIKKIEAYQENQLIDDGMYGGKEVNASMAIFLLKANHGMIETERRELVGKNGEPLSISFILGNEYIPTIGAIDGTPEGSAGVRSLPDGSQIQDAGLAPKG